MNNTYTPSYEEQYLRQQEEYRDIATFSYSSAFENQIRHSSQYLKIFYYQSDLPEKLLIHYPEQRTELLQSAISSGTPLNRYLNINHGLPRLFGCGGREMQTRVEEALAQARGQIEARTNAAA